MDLKASFQATTEQLSTSIDSRGTPSPVQGLSETGPDAITWFNPLSSDQKTQAARFSLPDWLKWSKDTDAKEATESPTQARKRLANAQPAPQQQQQGQPRQHPRDGEASLHHGESSGQTSHRASPLQRDFDNQQIERHSQQSGHGRLTVGSFQSQHTEERRDSTNEPLLRMPWLEAVIGGDRQQQHGASGETVRTTRSLTNVLRHLSNIIERKGQEPRAYRDSDFKQYWMPDSQCKECYECGEKFTTFRRRHHCRICGQIFCSRCCNQEVPGKFMGFIGNLRVCTYCCKIVLSYAQSVDSSGDLRALQEDLKRVTEVTSPSIGEGVAPRKKTIFREEEIWTRTRTYSSSSVEASTGNPFEVANMSPSHELRDQLVADERKILLQDSAQLRELWLLIQHHNNGIMFHTHRYRLRAYNNCIVGSELVDWLLRKDKVTHRDQAVAIGQALLDAKWLESVTGSEMFRDEYALYRPGETASVGDSAMDISLTEEGEIAPVEDYMEPIWFREIDTEDKGNITDDDGLAKLDRSYAESEGKVTRTSSCTESLQDPHTPRDRQSTVSSDKGSYETLQKDPAVPWDDILQSEATSGNLTESFPGGVLPLISIGPAQPIGQNNVIRGWLDQENLNPNNGEQEAFERLRLATSRQLICILEQQLEAEGLEHSWGDTIMSLANRFCTIVKPDVRQGDDMDIRQYVHIKKVPGGNKGDCYLVHGAICTKHVAHKKMARSLSNPKILLLQAAVEHQRVENKFSSLEPIILQEHEYLKNCVAKMVALSPNILVVEKTVARLAQDLLLANDITVVLNVKPSVMARISRCTQGSLISSIDQVTQATLGKCLSFHQHRYELPNGFTKTLMFFDGCPAYLGCSIMLRGGTLQELRKVKKVLNFMLYAIYNSRLEISFLMDESAMPPVVSDPSDEMQTPSGASITTPLTGSESISEGLALMQGDSKDSAEEEKKEGKGAKTGIKEKMSTMRKLFGTKASGKGQAKTSVDETDGKGEDFVVLTEADAESGSLDSEEVISQELAEAMTDTDKPSMKAVSQEHQGDVNESQKDAPDNSPLEETPQVKILTSNGVEKPDPNTSETASQEVKTEKSGDAVEGMPQVTIQQSGSITDFDHEATTKKFVSHLNPNIDDRADSVSLASFEDVTVLATVQGGGEKGSRFADALNTLTLSVSPFIKYTIPYMETSTGKASKLRKFLPPELFWSAKFSVQSQKQQPSSEPDLRDDELKSIDRCTRMSDIVCFRDPHPFTFSQLTRSANEEATRALLADFRARGGRIVPKELFKPAEEIDHPFLPPDNSYPVQSPETTMPRAMDCLDLYSHQHIALQFSSYSHMSSNAPNHCVHPWVVTMEFYRRHDLTLGEFLEKFCFSPAYHCPSPTCDTSMVNHVRRFVHGTGAIYVLLRRLESPIPGFTDKILMWSWCRKCKQVSSVQPMSLDTWHMSFGKYLELRFYGREYSRRGSTSPCTHSLHRHHFQYFGQHNMVASFKYSTILLRELSLPPLPLPHQQAYRSPLPPGEEYNIILGKSKQVFGSIFAQIEAITVGADVSQHVEQKQTEFIILHQADHNRFGQHLGEVQTKIAILATLMPPHTPTESLPMKKEADDLLFEIEDYMVQVKRLLCEIVTNWNIRFNEFLQQEKERNKKRGSPTLSRKISGVDSTPTTSEFMDEAKSSPLRQGSVASGGSTPKILEMGTLTPSSFQSGTSPSSPSRKSAPLSISPQHNKAINQPFVPKPDTLPVMSQQKAEGEVDDSESKSMEGVTAAAGTAEITPPVIIEGPPPIIVEGGDSEVKDEDEVEKDGGNTPRQRDESDASTLEANSFLSEGTKMEYGISPGLYAGLAFKGVERDIERPHSTDSGSSRGTPTSGLSSRSESAEVIAALPYDQQGAAQEGQPDHPDGFFSSTKVLPSEHSSPSRPSLSKTGSDMRSFFKTLLPGSGLAHIAMPYQASQHFILPPCTLVPIVIYDQEPSSIIAYALSSQQYKTQLYECQQKPQLVSSSCEATPPTGSATSSKDVSPTLKRKTLAGAEGSKPVEGKELSKRIGQLTRRTSKGVLSFLQRKASGQLPPQTSPAAVQPKKDEGQFTNIEGVYYQVPDGDSVPSTPTDSRVEVPQITVDHAKEAEDFDFDAPPNKSSESNVQSPHIELQFSDPTNSQFFCRVYFAEQFRQFRKTVFPDGEETYIRSLSRCIMWLARGGKSGSKFLKTRDNRFVLKQISRFELPSFLEFAPHYFQYIQKAYQEQKPTALAKILGVYKVGYRNPVTNTAQKQDLLVMENLFYKRKMSQVFDLKGSIRNRHVKTTGQEVQPDLVLMDENLLKHMVDSPLYIRAHCKTALALAIHYDATFLASHLIMDYSLLVGLDENSDELVVGVIDYIRTFTWDKKLEMIVKSSGIVGGQGKMPTVVSPELYRTRFCEAMDKYFLLVADRWTGLGQEF